MSFEIASLELFIRVFSSLIKISPLSGFTKPYRIFIRVVLPAPFPPTIL